jgi:hypothetical protein
MTYQDQHAAARAAIRDTILGQSLAVELLVDALLLPAHPYLRQEAAWAFAQVGRGIIFIDYLPLMQDHRSPALWPQRISGCLPSLVLPSIRRWCRPLLPMTRPTSMSP